MTKIRKELSVSNYDSKEKEHAFVAIGRDLKEGGFPNPLLLCGEEGYLINWAMDLLISTFTNPSSAVLDVTFLDGKEVKWDEIMGQCDTWPLLSQKRIVAVRDFSPENKEILEDLLHLPDYSMLIFLENGVPDKSKKNGMATMVNASGKIYEFNALSDTQLKGFITKRLKASGLTAKPAILSQIINGSGYGQRESTYDLYQLVNDLNKMIAHSNQQELFADDVRECLSENLETNIFAMLDAIGRNRKDEAFQLLHDMLRVGENPYRLLSSIATQIELMLCVKELRMEGKGPSEIKGELKVHELRIKKALTFSEKFSVAELKQILLNVYRIDKQIKTGLLETELALEMMIAEI